MGEPGVAWTAQPDDPLQVQPVDRDMSWIPSGTGADKHNPEGAPIRRDGGWSPDCFRIAWYRRRIPISANQSIQPAT